VRAVEGPLAGDPCATASDMGVPPRDSIIVSVMLCAAQRAETGCASLNGAKKQEPV